MINLIWIFLSSLCSQEQQCFTKWLETCRCVICVYFVKFQTLTSRKKITMKCGPITQLQQLSTHGWFCLLYSPSLCWSRSISQNSPAPPPSRRWLLPDTLCKAWSACGISSWGFSLSLPVSPPVVGNHSLILSVRPRVLLHSLASPSHFKRPGTSVPEKVSLSDFLP